MAIAVECALAGKRCIWGAPTFDQVNIGFEEMRHAAATVADFNRSRMQVTFPSGGTVLFRSLDDPDNARGHSADAVFIDEAGDVDPVAWYEVLRPMLIDTQGESWIGGTPKGRNWFWQEWIEASQSGDAAAWQAPTLGVRIENGRLVRAPHPLENPDIAFEEMVRLYETSPERTFRQEILAEFVEGEGAVFRRIREAAVLDPVAPGYWPEEAVPPRDGGRYIFGVDWAQSKDYTVIAIVDADMAPRPGLVAMDRFNQIDWNLQRGRLIALAKRWKPADIWAEKNSMGGPNIEELQRAGLPVRAFDTTPTSKPPLIESLVLAFEQRELDILNSPVLIGELEAYERRVSPVTGRSQYGAPPNQHDDTVIALALAWHGAHHPMTIEFAPNPFYGG